ncbi:MAG: Gfo/Idh/MocA family oxidoreductase [Anaerolineae bacterium]|nr:Gfo/Idh/MocA family oxidoreductase [Anaerolineae bacterium]
MSSQTPIRLALIGAGIFASKAYLPALRTLRDRFQVIAVGSRSLASAEALAAQFPGSVEATDDIAALLARAHDDIEAVSITTPIHTLPALAGQALRAGKHVLSEKPIAPTVETGRRLLEQYASCRGQVWMVGENYRYEPAFVRAAEIVRDGDIGRTLLAYWTRYSAMTPQNPYYQAEWRRAGAYPGGMLLDGGIHQIAALRLVLGEIASVSAHVAQLSPDLPPADTVSASLRFDGGVIGAYTVTYATHVYRREATPLVVIGEEGILRVDAGELSVERGDTTQITRFGGSSVEHELGAFAAAIREGAPHRNTPPQALQDVAVLEAILHANATGERVAPARILP